FFCPALHLAAVIRPPPAAVPHQVLLPGVAVPDVAAVPLGEALGVTEVGQVEAVAFPVLLAGPPPPGPVGSARRGEGAAGGPAGPPPAVALRPGPVVELRPPLQRLGDGAVAVVRSVPFRAVEAALAEERVDPFRVRPAPKREVVHQGEVGLRPARVAAKIAAEKGLEFLPRALRT